MKILYLHGYEAKPNEERIKYLVEELGCDVHAPRIDYNERPNIIDEYLKKDFDMVIGSSLGAYVGYYISTKKEIPSVLFNPPLHMDIDGMGIKIEKPYYSRLTDLYNNDKWSMINVVLGKKDEIVKANKVRDYLENNYGIPNLNIITLETMTHIIKLDEFKETVQPIVEKYSNVEEEEEA